MKKNRLSRFAILVLILAMTSMTLVSGTFAKYTSEISGTATGTVAKWAWTIGDDEIKSASDVTNGFTLNLFDTILDSDVQNAETDVATEKIAPGTSGQFEIELTNDSEVNAQYAIDLEETSNTSNIPIEYSTDGSTWVKATDLAGVSATDINMNASATLTLYWRWAFTGSASTNYTSSQTDVTDTALGFAANTTAPTVEVTATITVTQKD
jgi:hypothetical protein